MADFFESKGMKLGWIEWAATDLDLWPPFNSGLEEFFKLVSQGRMILKAAG